MRPYLSRLRRNDSRSRSRSCRLWLELLEERMLLATFTVTDTSDSVSDTGSLRYAITQSNLTGPGPNTIDFDIPGTGMQTIIAGFGPAGGDRAGDDRRHHAARLSRPAA